MIRTTSDQAFKKNKTEKLRTGWWKCLINEI
jgi:hypothetical protein